MKRAYKFRIYPNRKQEKKIEKSLDQACFLYNTLLNIKQQVYVGEELTLGKYDMNELGKDFELPNLFSQVKQNISDRLIKAFDNFFRRVKSGKKAGYPKFQKRINYNSITYPQMGFKIFSKDRLQISKIGMVKFIQERNIDGNIKTLTIKKEANEWYVILSCDDVLEIMVENKFENEVIGIDVGLKEFLVTSNDERFSNPRFLRKAERKLKRLSRKHSKKKKGSINKRKSRLKLAVQHLKVKRQRKDFHLKLARDLTSRYKHIGVENLNISGLVKNHCLAKSINDVGWGQFISYLEYYKTIFDGDIIKVDKFFPSSKTCSCCGGKQKIELSERIFKCKSCGFKLDRDLNASINIRNQTIKELNNTEGQSEIYVCGDNVRPSFEFSIQNKANVKEAETICSAISCSGNP